MSTLKFTDVHNLVAFLTKPTESEGFEQIVDFLNANPIKYALTVNPTVYTSSIEQFWATGKAKTVNEEAQLQALVDEKKKKSKSRRTKRKDTEVRQLNVPISVADEAVNEEMYDSLERAATTATSLDCQEAMRNAAAQTRFERVSKISNDPLLVEVNTSRSGEDSLKLIELMELCTKLQERVLDLKTTKTTQAMEIKSLKRRVKKLERRKRSRTHGLKRLYKVRLPARVESFEDKGLSEEDASKQEMIANIDANTDIYLVNVHTDKDIFGVNDDDVIVEDAEILFDVADDLRELKSAMPKAATTTATTTITTAILRPKAKIINIHNQEQAPTPTVSSQQPSQLQAEEEEEEKRIIREKAQQIKEVNMAWDDVQAKINDDYELAQRLQAKEQDELTDEEKEKLFMEFLEKKRNRPPTKAQQGI
nr:hypothetical protein [Tanacetum cinerariifolium]